jgi:pimeloyl-ACP methyl ester carboxylesterase
MVNHFRKHMKRPLIGIGHSMGGNNLVNLSLMHPRLFTSLILIDPVIQRLPSAEGNFGPAKASTTRRELWPSRQAAAEKLKSSKFYKAWDPRVLDRWIQYGLRELPTYHFPYATAASATPPTITADPSTATVPPAKDTEKQVTLRTTKHQEVLTFLRPNFPTPEYPNPSTEPNLLTHSDVDPSAQPSSPFYSPVPIATFHRLPYVRPSVFYIFGDPAAGAFLSAPVLKADKLAHTGVGVGGSGGVKKGRVSSVTFDGVGHLIPMEVVERTADECVGWLKPEVDRWRKIEDEERAEWAAVPREKKSVLSEQYVKVMTGDWMGEAEERAQKKSKL